TSSPCSLKRPAAKRPSPRSEARIACAQRWRHSTSSSASKPQNSRPSCGRWRYDGAMDEEPANHVYGDPLARWFVTEAYRIADTVELIAAAGERLAAAGIPLYRLAYFQLTLHPEFAGKGYFWRRGRGLEVGEAPHGLMQGPEYLDNPLPPVLE